MSVDGLARNNQRGTKRPSSSVIKSMESRAKVMKTSIGGANQNGESQGKEFEP